MPDLDLRDYDGCSLACRPRNKPWGHTAVWGECAYAEQPEKRINVGPRAFLAADGEMSIGYDTYTVTEMADKVEAALRSVPLTGWIKGVSNDEYGAMALAVAQMLAGEEP